MTDKAKQFEENLNLAKKIAKKNGGTCITKIGQSKNQKYSWQCREGHHWDASLANIAGNRSKVGTWCPYCKGVRVESGWMIRLQKKAKEKNGKCLDSECKNQMTKIRFKCSEGHIWSARASHIINGSWCPECAGNIKHTIKLFYKIAKEKGGKCLSRNYKNQRDPLIFRCKEGHQWTAAAGNIITGSWCPHCAKNVTLSIQDLIKIARSRGGRCLSDKYLNAHAKYTWECSEKHTWSATYGGISSGSWCPICSEFIGERIVRTYFENVFGMKFVKQHPKWLRKKKGDPWELDGVGEKTIDGYQIAFEHNGIQHYEYSPMFHKTKLDLVAQKKKDQLRMKRCLSNKVLLIEIPQIFKLTSLEQLSQIVQRQLKKYNKIKMDFDFDKVIDYAVVYKNFKMDDLRKIADEKGGKFLGFKIIKNKQFALIKCRAGHEWEVVPASLKNGTWCPYCAGKKVDGGWFEHYKQIAFEKGGVCLSKEIDYVDARTNLKWKCGEGHIWEASPSSIKGRTWCPKCGIKKRSESQKDTIERMNEIAKSKGGFCLSSVYLNNHAKLKWKCHQGHQWEATPGSVKSGSWCPSCYLDEKRSKR